MLTGISFSIRQRKFWKSVRARRAEWSSVIAGKEMITIPVSSTSRIGLKTSSELSSHIYSGAFEWEEREWLSEELKNGQVVYDIGANIGYFILLFAEACGKNGKVFAFEPVNTTFSELSLNVKLNPHLSNIQLFQVALSDSEGEQQIYIPANGKDAWNSLAVKPSGNYVTESIKTTTADSLLNAGKIIPPDLVKLDVEGWELHTLKGMHEILSRYHPTLLVEFTRENLVAAGTSGDELAQYIIGMGYSLYEYSARHRKLVEVTSFDTEHKNLIAKKNS